jgi:hypothetical protein
MDPFMNQTFSNNDEDFGFKFGRPLPMEVAATFIKSGLPNYQPNNP